MSGIEGAKVEVYREVVKPEALVAEGVTDERGFFRTTLPPARYIIITTWVDEEGVTREIRKEEELTATTQLVVNLPAPRIVRITEKVSLVPLARLKESIAEQVSLVPEARLAESIAEQVSVKVPPKVTVSESISESVNLVPIVSISESIGESVLVAVG